MTVVTRYPGTEGAESRRSRPPQIEAERLARDRRSRKVETVPS